MIHENNTINHSDKENIIIDFDNLVTLLFDFQTNRYEIEY
jgi:hypothetical protein